VLPIFRNWLVATLFSVMILVVCFPEASAGEAASLQLRAGTRDEAANLSVAVTVVIGPHNGRAETVGLSHNGVVWHYKPFSVNPDTIMILLCVPIDVLHADAVGKRTAQALSAGETIEPRLERRISKTAVVTRHGW